MPRKAPCRHCKRLLTVQARGLCKRCYDQAPIRMLYNPVRAAPREQAALDASKLTPPRPDCCRHGKPDGLCVPCEREERAALALTHSAKEKEA